MLSYQPAFSPRVPPPTPGLQGRFLGQVPINSRSLSQWNPGPFLNPRAGLEIGRAPLAQTFEEVAGWPGWCGDVLRLTFHSGTTYLGIAVGLSQKSGFLKYFAWVLGVGNGLAAIADAISIGKRIAGTHPVTTCPPCVPGTVPQPLPPSAPGGTTGV